MVALDARTARGERHARDVPSAYEHSGRPPAPMTASMDAGPNDRLAAAFAVEERRGLMLASGARSAAVLVVLAWLAYASPERGLGYVWVLGTGALFLVTGLAQLWFYARATTHATAP